MDLQTPGENTLSFWQQWSRLKGLKRFTGSSHQWLGISRDQPGAHTAQFLHSHLSQGWWPHTFTCCHVNVCVFLLNPNSEKSFVLKPEWSQSDLTRASRLRYSQQWTLIVDSNNRRNIRTVLSPGPCVPVSGEWVATWFKSCVGREANALRRLSFRSSGSSVDCLLFEDWEPPSGKAAAAASSWRWETSWPRVLRGSERFRRAAHGCCCAGLGPSRPEELPRPDRPRPARTGPRWRCERGLDHGLSPRILTCVNIVKPCVCVSSSVWLPVVVRVWKEAVVRSGEEEEGRRRFGLYRGISRTNEVNICALKENVGNRVCCCANAGQECVPWGLGWGSDR